MPLYYEMASQYYGSRMAAMDIPSLKECMMAGFMTIMNGI